MVDRELDTLHRHVRLVYPYADTERTVREVFRAIAECPIDGSSASTCARLRRVARDRIHTAAGDDLENWRYRNSQLIAIEFREAACTASDQSLRAIGRQLADQLAELPADTVELLRLIAIEPLTDDELAHILSTTPTAAAQRIAAARRALDPDRSEPAP